MIVNNGSWIAEGETDESKMLKTPEALSEYIRAVGFLPLMKCEIDGFSAEEHCDGSQWWTGGERDVWEWRSIIASGADIAYGKFFRGKAGFISREWFPVFAALRRGCMSFEERLQEGLAGAREAKLMEALGSYSLLPSFELKSMAGFGSGGEKGFETSITKLQAQTFVIVSGFARKKNKKGEEYGWAVANYITPEAQYGAEAVESEYSKGTQAAKEKLLARLMEQFPQAKESDAVRLIVG